MDYSEVIESSVDVIPLVLHCGVGWFKLNVVGG